LVPSGDFDVVALELVPVNHLLSALCASVWVAFTPYRGVRLGDRSGRRGPGDAALESLMVHVGLTTSIGNPTPSANAAARRARWHSRRNIVGSYSFPRGVIADAEDGKVIGGHCLDIRHVGDGKCGTSSHGPVLGMHVGGGNARRNIIVLGVGGTIGPVRRITSTIGHGGLCTVGGNLNGEGSTSGEVDEVTVGGRKFITAIDMVEPPILEAKLVQGVHDAVRVEILRRGSTVFAVHSRVVSS